MTSLTVKPPKLVQFVEERLYIILCLFQKFHKRIKVQNFTFRFPNANLMNLFCFQHGYDHYNSHFEDTQISGSIKTTVYENRIFIKLSVSKQGERFMTNLDHVRVNTIR